jgi:diguanylate cyclase (GGDEF)-like protein
LFMQLLDHAMHLSQRHPNRFYAVLFIDLDRFKMINDSLGHTLGDELLKSVAQRLQTCVRDSDTVARFGGDEFAILIEELVEVDEAIEVAKRIHNHFSSPFNIQGYEMFTTMSIGIAPSTILYQQASHVLRDADTAMYHAKAQGRNRYAVFDPEMQTQVTARLQLESDLRRAIETQEFCLYYQPIISLSTGSLRGFEALVRWNHPQRGMISPMEFIPVAEETGLIIPLGWWVLQEACHQLSQWLSQFRSVPPLVMNVNLSAIQLKQVELLEKLEKVLQETRIPRNCLKLEITESCILETSTSEAQRLKQLKDLGIGLCIDDFGTGYSSLSRLHEFPIDTLKIDRSFVQSLSTSSGETVRMIVTLAHSLEMDVVAEGIETTAELEALKGLGCEFGQGYLFSPPVNSQTAGEWLNN